MLFIAECALPKLWAHSHVVLSSFARNRHPRDIAKSLRATEDEVRELLEHFGLGSVGPSNAETRRMRRKRETLLRRYYEGWTLTRIGKALHLSRSTVRRWLIEERVYRDSNGDLVW